MDKTQNNENHQDGKEPNEKEGIRSKIDQGGQTSKTKELLQLAHNYHHGINGVNIDNKRTWEIYEKIKSDGGKLDGNAFTNLGFMFQNGYYLEESQPTKCEMYKKAADYYKDKIVEDLDPIDWRNVGMLYVYTGALAPQCDENVRKGVAYIEKGALAGDPVAMCSLGRLYEDGVVKEKCDKTATEWYIKASETGIPWGLFSYAQSLELGLGVEKDFNKALELHRKAAEKGERDSMYYIGLYYYNGEYCREDEEMAKFWWMKAAELGSVKADKELEELIEYDLDREKRIRIMEMSPDDSQKALNELDYAGGYNSDDSDYDLMYNTEASDSELSEDYLEENIIDDDDDEW